MKNSSERAGVNLPACHFPQAYPNKSYLKLHDLPHGISALCFVKSQYLSPDIL